LTKKMRFLLPALVLLTGSAVAEEFTEGYIDGNRLWDICRSDVRENVACNGFVVGVADAMSVAQTIKGGSIGGWRMCSPENVSVLQMKDVATRFLREHPEWRHLTGASLVARALAESFPCAPKSPELP
jgi:hypothetical protein